MAETKTKPTTISVADFIDAIPDVTRRADGKIICDLMARITGEEPQMWGPSIVGFGSYHYRYDSGHEGTACRLGFSPRKAQQVLYILTGEEGEEEKLARLGKHKTGKACLYVNKLADVDIAVLEELIRDALASMNAKYPS